MSRSRAVTWWAVNDGQSTVAGPRIPGPPGCFLRRLPGLPRRHDRQRRVPVDPGVVPRHDHREPLVGAQRLQHRVRGVPDRLRPTHRPAGPASCFRHRCRGVHGCLRACARAAPSVGFLVAARVVQALGAALLVPASLALVVEAFPEERRAHAIGLWGATAAVAAGLGPPLGGALVELGGWRWAFFVNIPFGVAAAWVAHRELVESRAPGRRRLPDLRGAALMAAALGALNLGIVKGSDWGWDSLAVVVSFVAAGVLTSLFVLSSRKHSSPLLDPALLRIKSFSVASLATLLAGIGFYSYLLTNILWLQYVWHYSVLQAGLALVPGRAGRRGRCGRPRPPGRPVRLPSLRRPGRPDLGRRLLLVPPAGGAGTRLLDRVAPRTGAQRHRGRRDPAACWGVPRSPPYPGGATPLPRPWCRACVSSEGCWGSRSWSSSWAIRRH